MVNHSEPVLDVRHLSVRIPTEDGVVHAVHDVSFSIRAGELFGIVGESGSGKSVLTQAIVGLLPKAEITGEALFDGVDLLKQTPAQLRRIRGARIGMVFQDPLSSLHPFYRVGAQVSELIRAHEHVTERAARARVVELFRSVGIADPEERYASYPHQFSGGMRQRVMIAMALALNPSLIVADEPTTALDVTVQAQIIELLREVQQNSDTTVLMITHDLGMLAEVADDVMVMYAGNRLEIGSNEAIFRRPAHPYTAGLLRSSPVNYTPGADLVPIAGRPPSLLTVATGCVFADRCAQVMPHCTTSRPPVRRFADGGEAACWLETMPSEPRAAERREPSLAPVAAAPAASTVPEPSSRPLAAAVHGVHLTYTSGPIGKRVHAHVLKGIDLEIRRGETLGLVGESGCGKSTLARVMAGLIPATEGTVEVGGVDIAGLDRTGWRRMRQEVQLVFQDPIGSLNPKRRVGSIIGDPFRIHGVARGRERTRRVQELMEVVGLNPEHYNRFPSEFSGGQRQRIGIARALALNPSLVICDEPVSALDVSIQAQILNLLKSLQRELDLTYLFISHDLAVVRHVCDRIAVMDGGSIVELEPTEELYSAPRAPFTRKLLSASMVRPYEPSSEPRRVVETVGAAS